jgi:hypothetical protein
MSDLRVLVLGLGRRATAEGSRGFQPTAGHPAKPTRRGATMEPAPRDRRPISFAPMTAEFHRRSATNHSCAIAIRGLKPTATVKYRSATGGVSRWSVRAVAVRQGHPRPKATCRILPELA